MFPDPGDVLEIGCGLGQNLAALRPRYGLGIDCSEKVVEQAIAENAKSAEDYRNGKAAALKFVVGQVMRLSKGKANAQMATEMLVARLGKG